MYFYDVNAHSHLTTVSLRYICESLLAPWVSIFSSKVGEAAKLQNTNRGVTSIKSLSFSVTTFSPGFI